MTLSELEQKITALEQELLLLRQEVARLKGAQVIPGIGPIGTFKDDPTFAEAVRLGREYREEVNRASLEEFECDEVAAKAKKRKPKAQPKPRKANARS